MEQYLELVRHFANRFVLGDLVSPQGERSVTVANILAMLAAPGAFISMALLVKYPYLAHHLRGYSSPAFMPESLGDKYFFVTLSMVLVGFVTVIQWDTFMPDLIDFMVLTPLPLKPSIIFAAKATTILLLMVVLSVVVNAGHCLIFPAVVGHAGMFVSHAVSVFGACAFIFLSLVALQGTLMSVLGYKTFQRATRYAQFLVILWLVFLVVTIPSGGYLGQSGIARFFPSLWFLGLYETMLGQPRPGFVPLGRIAVIALGIVAVLAPLSYVLSYARHLKRSLEADVLPAKGSTLVGRAFTELFNRLVVRDPLERATFYFLPQTILRSGRHRLYLSAYVGVGCAFVLEGLVALISANTRRGLESASVALLSIPLVLSFFLLSGLRVVFAMPAEVNANWVFRLTENPDGRKLLAGVRRAVMIFAVVPLFAALLPWHIYLLGWERAALHLFYDFVLSWVLLEALLINFRKVPFTCSYPQGKSATVLWWCFYWFCFTVYAYTMAAAEQWMLDRPLRLAVFCAVITVLMCAWTLFRDRVKDRGLSFIYEDLPEPVVRVLGIG